MSNDVDLSPVPDDLVEAARHLAAQFDKVVYLTQKPNGGAIKLPGEYWGLSFTKDDYDSHFSIHPDGRAMYESVYT